MTSALDYEVVGSLPSGQQKLKFTNNQFDDIIFTLGRVSFEEHDEGGMIMHYEYDVVEHKNQYVKEELDHAVGDLVMQLLDEGLKDNDIVYTGGIDENRDPDFIESD